MQQPEPETVTLNDILITEELSQRSPRSPNLQAENQAMRSLARQLARDSQTLLQTLVETALELCHAGTAGVSLLETIDPKEVFRWSKLAGRFRHDDLIPRDFSPCGVCVDRGTPQLFSYPERYFTYLQDANTAIVEALLLPLIADEQAIGAIWIMAHDRDRQFDAEDVRIMTSLADFTATALLLNQRQTGELLAANATLEAKIAEHQQTEAELSETQTRLKLSLTGAKLGTWTYRVGSDEFWADDRALQLHGHQPGEAKTFAEAGANIHPEDCDRGQAAFGQAIQTRSNLKIAYRVVWRDGSVHWVASSAEFAPGNNPDDGVFYGVVQDITEAKREEAEREQLEAALRESEAKYRSLFESIDESLCIFEMIYDATGKAVDYRFLEVNQAFERQAGLANAAGKLGSEIIPNTESYWLETYDNVIKTGEPQRIENYSQSTERWYQAYTSRVGGVGSRQVCTVFDDITDRKKAEAALQESEERQAYLLRLSDALRPLSDPIKIQEQALNIVGEYLDLDRVLYNEIDPDVTTYTVYVNYVREGFPSYTGSYPMRPFAESVKDLRLGKTHIIYDVENEEQFSEEERAICRGINVQAFVVVPLIKQGQWVVNVVAHYSKTRNWTQYDVSILEETAERTWAAVERARAEAALRELEVQRIREQSALEQERQRAESLAELDRAKTLFFTNISHEFRTPLTLSLAPLQDALNTVDEWMSGSVDENSSTHRPIDPSTLKQNLELVHRNSLRLLKLVNTLLNFSRIEAGRMAAAYEPTDLSTFMAELASVFRSAIERAGLQLIVDCPPLPEPVFVDREMWEKIVLNLLSNAFKFTFEGAVTVRLRPADGNRAILQIQDTGTGIAPEHLPHLFERFYQVRGTQARTHEGSGIGLALVHELVQLQGGTIEVSSTLGEGTCFTIALPFGTAHLPQERTHAPRTQTSTAIDAASYVEEAERWLPEDLDPPQPSLERGENSVKVPLIEGDLGGSPELEADALSSAHVLLVDDNADMREYLTHILGKYVQVEAVADGVTALAVAQERTPDLILSDVMMPGLNGFELLQALRTDSRTREVPVILLSARAGEEAIVEGLEAGADDYLIKPFSAQELISRVTAHLQMAQLRGAALQQERTINRQKDEFISVVSHELNTPLVSILGWTRMLRSSLPNPVILNKALDTIERNATLQGKLIQDLLDLSRITAGKFRLNPQPIELKPVIETAIATVTQTAANKEINLMWQQNATEPLVVMADGDRLQQVICNLLTNAIKFTPEPGNIRIELSAQRESVNTPRSPHPPIHSYAEIRVIDSGIGIAADFLPHVFDRFRQAEGANAAKGLGLGLAIAHHIVELHKGTISAESAGAGQGATFTVRLPLLQSSDDLS